MPKSDMTGRAFEYICIQKLAAAIGKKRSVKIIQNDNYYQDKDDWERLDKNTQALMTKEAVAAIPTLLELEPMIEETAGDVLTLKLQSDQSGIVGDVRDILIIREQVEWYIGISVKHNHFAVKHSRLASGLDFGKIWFDCPCSIQYWQDIKPIFDPLIKMRHQKTWNSLPNKENDVYIPLLNAFRKEILKKNENDKSIPSKLVEYLIGKYDFYKLIGLDAEHLTRIMAFNLRGTLNKPALHTKPRRTIPKALLPDRIVSFEMKPKSNNTLELYLNNGWQFSFRIHNASTLIEPSLKFDVQIMGMPTNIIVINCQWN